jgi:hypothetical protein
MSLEEEMNQAFEQEFSGRMTRLYLKIYVTPTGSTKTYIHQKDNRLLLFRKNYPTKLIYSDILLDNYQSYIKELLNIEILSSII